MDSENKRMKLLYNICKIIRKELFVKGLFCEDIHNRFDIDDNKIIIDTDYSTTFSLIKRKHKSIFPDFKETVIIQYQLFILGFYMHKIFKKIPIDTVITTDPTKNLVYMLSSYIQNGELIEQPDIMSFKSYIFKVMKNYKYIDKKLLPLYNSTYKDILLSLNLSDDVYHRVGFRSDKITYKGGYLYKTYNKLYNARTRFNNEASMYLKMQEMTNAFNLMVRKFDKEKMIKMLWDPYLISFDKAYTISHRYLYIILSKIIMLRNLKFYHGDFKSDNILINLWSGEVQIIDLEYSRILNNRNLITHDDICMDYVCHGDKDHVEYLSDEIMFLYDLFKLAISLKYSFRDIYNELKNSDSNVFKDFLILSCLHENEKEQYITSIYTLKEYFSKRVNMPQDLFERFIYLKEMIRNEVKKY